MVLDKILCGIDDKNVRWRVSRQKRRGTRRLGARRATPHYRDGVSVGAVRAWVNSGLGCSPHGTVAPVSAEHIGCPAAAPGLRGEPPHQQNRRGATSLRGRAAGAIAYGVAVL